MNDFVQITDEDRANIERFVGRRLSTVKDDEKAIFENLLNRGLIGWPQKTASSASHCCRTSPESTKTTSGTQNASLKRRFHLPKRFLDNYSLTFSFKSSSAKFKSFLTPA